MKRFSPLFFLFAAVLLVSAAAAKPYASGLLKITRLTSHTYIHESYLHHEKWGKIPCNGLVYISNGEAIVLDTPVDDSASLELVAWIEGTMRAKIKAVIVNHFHIDCLGGLKVFHERGIESYSHKMTQELAKADTVAGAVGPRNGFEGELVLEAGSGKVIAKHFGEGHAKDNVVSYIPSERVLFGGCLVKEMGAGKGNLADANTGEWPATVEKVKKAYPKVKHVVPGHGKAGNSSLLDYTIKLFGGEGRH